MYRLKLSFTLRIKFILYINNYTIFIKNVYNHEMLSISNKLTKKK